MRGSHTPSRSHALRGNAARDAPRRAPSGIVISAWLALWLALWTSAVPAQTPQLPPEDSEYANNAVILIGQPLGPPLEGAALDELLKDVASTMRCPVCQGLSVADSHTDTALAMQAEARELLAAGFTAEQTLQYFEESYGEFIRLEPKAEGFNLLVWIVPMAGVLAGLAVIAARLRGKASRRPLATADEPAAAGGGDEADLAEYLARVRSEVRGEPQEETT